MGRDGMDVPVRLLRLETTRAVRCRHNNAFFLSQLFCLVTTHFHCKIRLKKVFLD